MVLLRRHPGLRVLAAAPRRCFAGADASTLGSYAANGATADAPMPLSNGYFGHQSYAHLQCLPSQLHVDHQRYVPGFA